MILQALCEEYELLQKHSDIPAVGYTAEPISFCVELGADGKLLGITDLRVPSEHSKKLVPRIMKVPEHCGRTSGVMPYFLCDNAKYMLGLDGEKHFAAFAAFHETLLGAEHAITKFLRGWDATHAKEHPLVASILKELQAGNLVFETNRSYAHEMKENLDVWENYLQGEDQTYGYCLVTGEYAPIAKTHNKVKGVMGSNASGGTLVGVNNSAFQFYGREQAFNSPVSKRAMIGYTNALNYLLSNKRYNARLGDMTMVFWANQAGGYEDILGELLGSKGEGKTDEKQEAHERVSLAKEIVRKLNSGLQLKDTHAQLDENVKMYILGLSPNNARVAVALWHVDNFGHLTKNLAAYYKDLEIIGMGEEMPPVWKVILETVPKNVQHAKPSPVMAKELARAVVTGGRLPVSLYVQVLQRVRTGEGLSGRKAAIIKAYLNRNDRLNQKKEGLPVSLDKENKSIAYQLGRLFAVMEKAQREYRGTESGSSIASGYFASASTTPQSVFPRLLRLSRVHTQKLQYGYVYENDKAEILDRIGGTFPTSLDNKGQGEFMIGYYQQKQAFYEKKTKEEEK